MTRITLRMKSISSNRKSLYLDFYPPIPHPNNGRLTRREFLELYILEKPKTDFDRTSNNETLQLAESVRARRQLSIQKGYYGFLSDEKANTDFVKYFHSLALKRSGSNSDNWFSALHHLENFTKGVPVFFKNLTESFCNEFREYLLSAPQRKSKSLKLSRNSALSYFNKFKTVLKKAHQDGFLESDLNGRVKCIKQEETERQFLTLDELQTLAKTDCNNKVLKNASLFSALTGLRFSDIKKLTCSEVHYDQTTGYYIRFRQQKTKGVETLPIPEQAFNLIGEKGKDGELAFGGFKYSFIQTELPKWIKRAGINKHITFHCFRHTYATLQISLGTDIYTVSKMLGHRELKTTQVYAKIIDQTKRDAAGKIKLDL